MSTPIQVREARPAQYDAIGELTVSAYDTGGWAAEPYRPTLLDVRSRAEQARVLVALDGDALVGAVTVATRGGPYAEQAEPGEAVVRMLAVDRQVHGRGIGEALMRRCLELVRADGCTAVRLSTQPTMAAAHRLYERLGFVRAPGGDWRPTPDLLLWAYVLPLDDVGQRGAGSG